MNIREKYIEIIEGMKSENRFIQWNTMVKWYELMIEIENRELKPLLNLVYELKEIGFWDKYYPSQSHTALGLSKGEKYEKRLYLPMVYINYNSTDNNFFIQYQKGQAGETNIVQCDSTISKKDIEEIQLWLDRTNGCIVE